MLKYPSNNYRNPMPAPLQLHSRTASLHPCYASEYAQDSKLAGNQRCWVSRGRKGNGVCSMFKEAEILTERFCEAK
ncbi:unnamed protein product [Lasius platythorax]|uniref:Uncharacterized protein n=1 Tax=Lasius platythorax TaxID=488582 RepID=A0AAV2P6G8_9HYME